MPYEEKRTVPLTERELRIMVNLLEHNPSGENAPLRRMLRAELNVLKELKSRTEQLRRQMRIGEAI